MISGFNFDISFKIKKYYLLIIIIIIDKIIYVIFYVNHFSGIVFNYLILKIPKIFYNNIFNRLFYN